MKNKFTKTIILANLFLTLFTFAITFAQEQEVQPLDPISSLAEETTPSLDTEETSSPVELNTEAVPVTEHLVIRFENQTIFEADVSLPAEGVLSVMDSSGGGPNDVNARSVLGLLYSLDQKEDSFNISELVYYSSFSAFYLKCISFSGDKKCDSWQYKVNGEMASVGMDSKILSGGENIEVYFEPFFYEPEPTESVEPVAEPAEVASGRSSGGSSGSRIVRPIPEPPQDTPPVIIESLPSVVPSPVVPIVKKINKVKVEKKEIVTVPEPTVEPEPELELSAVVVESESSASIPVVVASITALAFIGYFGRRFLLKG